MIDKILQILKQDRTTISGNIISKDDICYQLGMNWEDIKETIGMMKIKRWVGSAFYEGGKTHGKHTFWLTYDGEQELRKRIFDAKDTRNKNIPTHSS